MGIEIETIGKVAVVTADSPPVNALGQALRQELWDAVERLDAEDGLKAVVLACAGRTFFAGADVREFGKAPTPPHLPDLVARIERSGKPWVAAIHGSALGGGLEVALGCRFRVATRDAALGFPEVTLGVVPGAGGTVRAPRLVGAERAVAMIVSGKPLSAPEALECGLVDKIVDGDARDPRDPRDLRALREGAIAFAAEIAETNEARMPAPLADRESERPADEFWNERLASVARAARGADAPLRALECVKRAVTGEPAAAFAFERETFLELRDSDQARALRRAFFAERAASRPPDLKGVEARPVRSVAVVGGGTMGSGIAFALLESGFPVVLVERDGDAASRALASLREAFERAARRGRLVAARADECMAGVTATADFAGLKDADLAIEAVYEDIGAKREVFRRLGETCRPDAVLATNTSYLDPRDIAESLPRRDRFLGMHFFGPAHVMKLLEIVPVPETAPATLAAAFELARFLGKIPVRAGNCEGFIGNRILKRYRSEAEQLVREGVAIGEVDGAMRDFGMAMGPFEAQDMGGLDIAFLQREAARAEGRDVPETLGDVLVRAGRKGRKTGGGWYDYAPGDRTPQPSAVVEGLLASAVASARAPERGAISRRLAAGMAEEGAEILSEGIAEKVSDIDLVLLHGYGFPRWRGGPMFHAAGRGAEGLEEDLGRPPSAALVAAIRDV